MKKKTRGTFQLTVLLTAFLVAACGGGVGDPAGAQAAFAPAPAESVQVTNSDNADGLDGGSKKWREASRDTVIPVYRVPWSPSVYTAQGSYVSYARWLALGSPTPHIVYRIAGDDVFHNWSHPEEVFWRPPYNSDDPNNENRHHVTWAEYLAMGAPPESVYPYIYTRCASSPAVYGQVEGSPPVWVSWSAWLQAGQPTPLIYNC